MKPATDRKALESLIELCEDYLDVLDRVMLQPSTVKRGQDIAKLSNILNMGIDRIRYGHLGVDFRKDKPLKERVMARAKKRQSKGRQR
jgi:hypothetical protein